MKKLYKMTVNFGRMGDITSLFMAPDYAIKNLIGKELSLGEALGKHSDVRFKLKQEHIEGFELDTRTIEVLEKANIFPTGHFPFAYCKEYMCLYCGEFKGFNSNKEFCEDCEKEGVTHESL